VTLEHKGGEGVVRLTCIHFRLVRGPVPQVVERFVLN
jgi:hypothetical protein